MVRVSPPAPSAASGELSELMFGRPDYVRYANGARAVRGFIVLPEGGVTRSPGTIHLGETFASADARLTKFVFKDEDAVLLEWTAALLRFWRQGALIDSGGNPYSIATPYSVAQADKIQSLASSDRVYLANGDNPPQRLSRFALDNWTIAATAFVNGPFRGRNLDETREIAVSGIEGSITLTASADIFDAAHVGVLFELHDTDTSDTAEWAADLAAVTGERYYHNGRLYEIAGFRAASGATGSTKPKVDEANGNAVDADATVRWTAIFTGNPGAVPVWAAKRTVTIGTRRFADGWTIEVVGFALTGKNTGVNPPVHLEGFWLAEKNGPVWKYLSDGSGVVRIATVTDARNATATVESRLPDGLATRPTYRWAEGAWSALNGYPRAIGAYQSRHIYGGTDNDPRAIWCSVIGGTVDMTARGADDDGFSYILESDERENGEIKTIAGAKGRVHIGTTAAEFFGYSTEEGRAFSEATAKFDSDTNHGAADARALVIDGVPVFLDKSGRRLIMLVQNDRGRFEVDDLTQIARHMLGDGCDKLVFQRLPIPIIWARLPATGKLVGCTFNLRQQLIGFHRHDLAGGHMVDMEVMPSDDGTSEVLELIVRRNVGAATKHFRERLADPFIDLDGTDPPLQDAWHQFCAIRYQGAPTGVIAGLDHLEGETVTAWTEFGAMPGLAVAGGAVTLTRADVTSAIVGLDATPLQRFDTLDIIVGTPDGGDDGRLRTHRVAGVRVHHSAGGTYSNVQALDGIEDAPDPQQIFPVDFGGAAALHSGVFEVAGHKGWAHQSYLRFQPEPGAPLTILGRTPTMMITDD